MRSSNIELLRIAAMFLIVLHHFSVHGTWPESGSFPLSSEAILMAFSFGGKIGVNVFVLITGYFMINSKFRFSSLLRVILETLFYSYILLALFSFITPESMSASRTRKALMPVVSGEYWFITNYIALMIVSPLLNALSERIGKTGLGKAVAIGFAMLSVLPTLTTFDPLASNFLWFVYLYLLGGWIRVASDQSDRPRPFDPLWYARRIGGFGLALISIAFCIGAIVLLTYLQGRHGLNLLPPKYFVGQNTIPVVLAAVGLLVGFSKLRLGSIKLVNNIAKTTLGIYLIHDNIFVRLWLWKSFASLASLMWGKIILCGLGISIAVFCICAAIDYMRVILLEAPVMKFINSHFESVIARIDRWFNSLNESGLGKLEKRENATSRDSIENESALPPNRV